MLNELFLLTSRHALRDSVFKNSLYDKCMDATNTNYRGSLIYWAFENYSGSAKLKKITSFPTMFSLVRLDSHMCIAL